MTGRSSTPDYPPAPPPECNQLTFDSSLTDPDLDVVSNLKLDEEIDVRLDDRYPAAYLAERRIGGIAEGMPGRLAACLRDGFRFGARVVELDGAYVKVRIVPR